MDIECEVDNRNPVVVVLDLMGAGERFEAVDMPKTDKKWYFNENGEYVRDDGGG